MCKKKKLLFKRGWLKEHGTVFGIGLAFDKKAIVFALGLWYLNITWPIVKDIKCKCGCGLVVDTNC